MSMLSRARLATVVVLVLGLALVIAAPLLALRGSGDRLTVAATPTPSPTPTPTTTPTPTPTPDPAVALADSWATLEAGLTGRPGLVVVPVGGNKEDAVRFGEAPGEWAWSTSKVPIAIAADIAQPESAQVDALITSAIRISDNDALERLWVGLGSSDQARTLTNAVLAKAGDTTTRMGENAEEGRTNTGYTTWRLEDQAVFAAGIACLPEAVQVVGEMGNVTEEQSWGLGTIEGAAFKGGWGLYGTNYTSRQFGLVPVDGTPTLAVAMTVENPEGDGTQDLDAMAAWLADNLDQFPAGTC